VESTYYASNLTGDVKKMVHDRCSRGLSDEGVYERLWSRVQLKVDERHSSHMWDDADTPFAAIGNVLRYRWGNLWSKKLAYRFRRPYAAARPGAPTAAPAALDSKCPLCGGEDSGTHILAGCQHPTIKSLVIRRHNEAVRMLQRTVAGGGLGGCVTIMDACKATECEQLGTDGTRLHQWMLPDVPEEILNKMRPDILVAEGVTQAQAADGRHPRTPEERGRCKVHVVEVGYCQDLDMDNKMTTKQQQHAQLVAALQHAGWRVRHHTILLGVGGTIYRHASDALLGSLRVERAPCAAVLKKLHHHAVRSAHELVYTRRLLERSRQPGPGTRPGAVR